MSPWTYELIGYAASLLVAFSLTMRSVLRLRIINMVGAAFFVLYGLLIQSYPVAGMNAFIVLVNLYYLAQMRRTAATYDVVEVAPASAYLRAFLTHHRDDLERYFAGWTAGVETAERAFLITREAQPVGVVLGRAGTDATFDVAVDYVIPGYRDLAPGRFFYDEGAEALRSDGVRRVCTAPGPAEHRRYLERIGFAPTDTPDRYCRAL